MHHVRHFPHRVSCIENTWIPMSDGVRLAAKIWMPEEAEAFPVPAVLEYIPYRKNDITARRDELNHHYFAGHGYASVRVDIRGSGESEGVLEDEYLSRELADCLEILSWLADREWCTGDVGMMGISWGGFNALQVAALAPPQLKAIITLCSSDDRYADDVHYMGGCLLGDNLSWASMMFAYNSCPPDPALVGERWRDMWLERLRNNRHWLEHWLSHQRRDAYWKHGSVCEDYSSVACPVMAGSGWADGYTNAVGRLMQHLDVPRIGLIGPWSHKYPHMGVPGPAIGFLQEAVRWWNHWLKGMENGIMDGPMIRLWMQESVPPSARYGERPGYWVAESGWPPPSVKTKTYGLAPNRLVQENAGDSTESLQVQSLITIGLFAGKWCSYSAAPDLPHDQREEDGSCLVFDSEPLENVLPLLGAPEVHLSLSTDRETAMVAVRLSDVAPDGRATRVTYGLLNLTHRNSHEYPEKCIPGKRFSVSITMNDIGYVIPAGHRVRLAVSTSYWPLAWTAPQPVMLTLYPDLSSCYLPVRTTTETCPSDDLFGPPESAEPLVTTILEPPHHNWRVIRDLASGESKLVVTNDEGIYRLEHNGMEVEKKTLEWYTARDYTFDSIRGETWARRGFRRAGWNARSETRTILTSTSDAFHVSTDLDAYENDVRIFCESRQIVIHRDLV